LNDVEIVVVIVALLLLAILSQRYGHDSRPGAESKEQEIARFGIATS
jgi:hypothetical protein